jgi:hypothetical protein
MRSLERRERLRLGDVPRPQAQQAGEHCPAATCSRDPPRSQHGQEIRLQVYGGGKGAIQPLQVATRTEVQSSRPPEPTTAASPRFLVQERIADSGKAG